MEEAIKKQYVLSSKNGPLDQGTVDKITRMVRHEFKGKECLVKLNGVGILLEVPYLSGEIKKYFQKNFSVKAY